MVFPIVVYGCESWTIKKAECWRIDAFELWWWRRLLRVPWTARRSTQSILKEVYLTIHWKDWWWSWSSNTLATDEKSWHIRKDPDAGKHWRQEKKGMAVDETVGWHHRLNGHELNKLQEVVIDSKACSHGVTKSGTQLNDWTELNWAEVGFRKVIQGGFSIQSNQTYKKSNEEKTFEHINWNRQIISHRHILEILQGSVPDITINQIPQ